MKKCSYVVENERIATWCNYDFYDSFYFVCVCLFGRHLILYNILVVNMYDAHESSTKKLFI